MNEEYAAANAILFPRQGEDGIEVCFGPGDHSVKVIKISDVRALNFATQLIELVSRRMK